MTIYQDAYILAVFYKRDDDHNQQIISNYCRNTRSVTLMSEKILIKIIMNVSREQLIQARQFEEDRGQVPDLARISTDFLKLVSSL